VKHWNQTPPQRIKVALSGFRVEPDCQHLLGGCDIPAHRQIPLRRNRDKAHCTGPLRESERRECLGIGGIAPSVAWLFVYSRAMDRSFNGQYWVKKLWFSLHPSMVAKTRAIHGRIVAEGI
jgi:hypothetical protein